ncbi:DUF4376 domain-containing protein [Amorphus orientalis]|uniref:DUF4376 domain-containing protein n=1 Tax=Amorphus orientalis TaxID=649198 RepID=A0AAE3VMU8_9HYPH|nr:hypothetical protein [Amorphus orientalis]MDQ0314857.1 hypothetical protein [Amorphus orientalis]
MSGPTVYSYDPTSGEALGSSIADPSPLEPGAFLDPAHTTRTPPPETGAGEAACWTGEAWEIRPDHRGETWYAADGAAVTVDHIGDPADDGLAAVAPPPTLEEARATKLAAISAEMADRLAAGAPTPGGLHVALDVGTRTDLGAMATTGGLAASGSVTWSDSYKLGWITIENDRIPLPTPADGIALAASVGDYYAQIRQHGRDLKDAALAAADETELDAIDEAAGWP